MALPTFFQKLFDSYGSSPKIKEAVTLPAQSGNSGKFMTTNGSATNWGTPTPVPDFSAKVSVTTPYTATQDCFLAIVTNDYYHLNLTYNGVSSVIWTTSYGARASTKIIQIPKNTVISVLDSGGTCGIVMMPFL